MKGHLQRLAASAARPAQSVRPLVRGLFNEDTGRAQEMLEETSEVRTSQYIEPAAERQPVRDEKPVERRLEVMREEARAFNQKKTEAPMAERPVERLVMQQVPSDDKAESRKPGSDRQEIASVVPATRIESVRALEVHPLLVERPEVEEVSETDSQTVSAQRSAEAGVIQPRVESLNREQERRENPRTSNEVQIHIGRIEVIAVPPPATQRAAATPERRGESLDDYLRRKDRRAR